MTCLTTHFLIKTKIQNNKDRRKKAEYISNFSICLWWGLCSRVFHIRVHTLTGALFWSSLIFPVLTEM